MADEIYEQLADVLDKLPNGFPRTPSNVEIQLLKKIFSPNEASIASRLSGTFEPVEIIAERINVPVEKTKSILTGMGERGLLWHARDRKSGQSRFRLAPFIVGFYEAQLKNMNHELAHLFEEYMADGGAAGIMKPQPALHRVIPAQKAVKSEWILPYDDVKKILVDAKKFRLRDCICRVQQEHLGRKCNFPTKMCLSFSSTEGPPHPDDLSQKEALEILDKAEEIGLVHTVSNIMKGIGYVCNCCGCCCGILRGITEHGIKDSVAYANYTASIDPESCLGCGTCIKRCQVHAISEQNGVSCLDQERCIGCGLCVTGCPNDAAELRRKKETEIVDPPLDFGTWEHDRLMNRGLTDA